MLIPSANDAANVLAEHVSGSIKAFALLMNRKASDIGCKDSHFTNPSGVHDENLYTTAYDLSLIARYAMQFETFRKIITTPSYTLPSTEIYPKNDRTFEISNDLVKPTSTNYYYEFANGIKTGYTNPARDCIVASASKDGVDFIIVILGDGLSENNIRTKYVDCKTLFDFAFANYTSHYKELQEKSEIKSVSTMVDTLQNSANDNINHNTLYLIFKIVAMILILLSAIIIFIRK